MPKVTTTNYDSFLESQIKKHQLHISEYNQKVNFSTVDLYPCISCPNSTKLCRQYCYVALNLNRTLGYKAYILANWNLLQSDRDKYFSDLDNYMDSYSQKFFRFHSSGDIPDQDYYDRMTKVVEKHSSINFLCFTKSKLDYSYIPANLSLVYSYFPDTEYDNPYNLPCSYAVFPVNGKYNDMSYHYSKVNLDQWPIIPESKVYSYNHIKSTSVLCPGSCEKCLACWTLAKVKQNVYFHIHGTSFNIYRKLNTIEYPI